MTNLWLRASTEAGEVRRSLHVELGLRSPDRLPLSGFFCTPRRATPGGHTVIWRTIERATSGDLRLNAFDSAQEWRLRHPQRHISLVPR